MHRSREAGLNRIENHLSRPGDFGRYHLKMNTRITILFMLVIGFVGCTRTHHPSDPIPSHDTFSIESASVGETRVICVWTPPGYGDNSDCYPVIYMPDGGIKEDFPHIANTLAKLVAENSIPPMLLVGIENTERRRDLTGPSENAAEEKIAPLTDGSTKFRQFINDELFPEINKRYRTTSQRSIIGESAAGLFVVETLLLRPRMFDAYIAMDPAIYWNNKYLVRTAAEHLAELPDSEIRFWYAGSDAGDIQPHTRELETILDHSAPESLKWMYSDQPNEQHNTIFRATKEAAIKWTLGTKTGE